MPDSLQEKIHKQGVQTLTNLDLVQVIISPSIVKVSNSLKQQALSMLFNPEDLYSKLTSIPISPLLAAKIVAALELGKRVSSDAISITKPAEVIPFLQDIKDLKQENLIVICLDGAGGIISKNLITVGTISHTLIHPREVFAPAIVCRASAIILAHNHPSGNPAPSSHDLKVTKNLRQAGQIIGISLEDHIIIAKQGFYSFKQQNQLD